MRLPWSERPFERNFVRAKKVLEDNWLGSYTRPAQGLYPHQWNWDSAFIAIGYANYRPERAMRELRHLFSAQWPNGMVPHIVFNRDALGEYFPEPDFWSCPDGRQTSGITMPPLHAVACLRMHRLCGESETSRAFLVEMYPKLVAAQRYLYRERDPEKEGLVYIRHPWESGRDNAPAWDRPLGNINLARVEVPSYQRKDLDKGVDESQRPSDEDYDRYVYLVDLFRRHDYDERAIREQCPFLIQDVGFNSILCRDNQALGEIAGILGEDRGEIDEWTRQTSRAIRDKLWSDRYGRFESFDLISGVHLDSPTAMGFMPLYARAVDSDKAKTLYDQMNSVSFCGIHQGNCFAIPDYDMTESDYDQVDYWRGPVWFNINWMLAHGLKDYGYYFEAQIMRKDMLELAARYGFREYYDSQSGRGLGSRQFSWSAALFIDLLCDYRRLEEAGPSLLHIWNGGRLGDTRVLNEDGHGGSVDQAQVSRRLARAMTALADAFFDPVRGALDYASIAGSPEYQSLQDALATLPGLDLAALGQGHEGLAFWIDLYNYLVIQGVIELGLSKSVFEISDFFKRVAYRVGPYNFSLNDIQHGLLRGNRRGPHDWLPPFRPWDKRRSLCFQRFDPRVHFALCCGARSCAKVGYFSGQGLDYQLYRAAESYISSEVLVNPDDDLVVMADMFKWYQDDFGGREDMLRFVAKYMPDDEHRRYLLENLQRVRVEYLFHDWHLNR